MTFKLKTNAEIIQLLENKIKTYEYFCSLTAEEYTKKINSFKWDIDVLKQLPADEVNPENYYNQDWTNRVSKGVKGKGQA